MWTRSLLKQNAKENLKKYYWSALGVTLVASILGANGGGFGGGGGGSYSSMDSESSSESLSEMDPTALMALIAIIVGILIFSMVFSLAYICFVGNPTKCGECKYFVTARNGDQKFAHLFDNYKGGNYLPTVKTMFFYTGEIWLWSLLFIIPGVIKEYEYALVPYIVAENPNIDRKRAKEISRQTMDGEKLNFWVLRLSFIGWMLLGLLCCCIGQIFVVPYQLATEAEFYMCMRAKMLSYGYTTEEELTGGFDNGMGGSDPSNMNGGGSSYNDPNFTNDAYNVPNSNPYQSNDQFNGQMPGVGDDFNNNNDNPYNQ